MCMRRIYLVVVLYQYNGNDNIYLFPGREALPWSTRVQIALDSARGLEYIHEHTVPVYIHRDIKPANILIDKNFHGKVDTLFYEVYCLVDHAKLCYHFVLIFLLQVADFGLTKLTDIGSTSLPTRLVGTFGYMSPE